MRVGLLGTGAIANKHAQAYRNIGFELVACSNKTEARGREFAERWGAQFIAGYRELCRYPGLDFIDVCTFPDFHLAPVRACAEIGRPVQLQKPIATNLETAREMIGIARAASIPLSVASQHRFDDATIFLKRAVAAGRLGRILEADAYVKWFRDDVYYARPIKGSWQTEGGGALINQAIHQVDLLRYLIGPVARVSGMWQLASAHRIESEDIVNALLGYESGATGVLQAATAFWPGYTERIEIHGTRGTAVISGDRLTRWDVRDDDAPAHDPPPLAADIASGASDPMAISLTSFERQFLDFADAIRNQREPLVNGEEGYCALEIVLAIYDSCRSGEPVELSRRKL
ncbi:MAG TPA: Gfo/Idh/MocA family oxidoreductase [Bryobacteraceae bacterium]|jgi:predicted dehydrogenase|nr:Gfo/Idh/MocA family oxidoreductase [Bryobacteraceae bacterium]